MNVQTELPRHPKYLRLRKAVGDRAMEYLISLWSHCQTNQRGEFWNGADAEYIELICAWNGEDGHLFAALSAPFNGRAGWIVPEPSGLRIHDWENQNLGMVNAWVQGRKGGRKPKANPPTERRETVRLPDGNPPLTGCVSDVRTNEENEEKRSTAVGPIGPSESESPAQKPTDNPPLTDRLTEPEPVIPTEAEVIAYGNGPAGIPADYCLDFHQFRTNHRLWLNNRGELILWEKMLREQWVKNRANWQAKKPAGSRAPGGDLEARLQTERDPDKRRALRQQIKNAAA